MGGDPKADDAIREALEGVADRASEKREALAALVVEGIDDGFRILEIRQQARWDYLQHCLGTPEGQEQLLGKFPDELGYVMDCLSEAEWLLCRKSQLWDEWWPRREDASVLMPYALRQAEPGEDDRDPFQLSNEPTTKGLAALRLAIIHDSVYVDDSILTMAINQEEDWPVRRELMVLHGVYCREDADLFRLFPEGSNPRRIMARLAKWETMMFGDAAEPHVGENAKKAKSDRKPVAFSDERIAGMLSAAIQAGDLKKDATHNAVAAWLRQSPVKSGLKTERRVGILKLVPEWTAGRKGNA